MNTPSLERYPFDSTGEAKTNLVVNELHIVPPGDKNKIFALLEGAAFSKSIKLRTAAGTYLRPWVDYQPVYLYPEATKAVGEACTGLVLVLNESVDGYLYAEYQVVGDRYGHNSTAVEDLLWSVTSDDRPVFWPDIKDRPSLFPAAPHSHNIFTDTEGWDARILLVDSWTSDVLEEGDQYRLDIIRDATAMVRTYLNARFNQVNAHIDTHVATPHAHVESKEQVGLGRLDNIRKATTAEARAGVREDLRLTVNGASAILSDAVRSYSANLMKQGILPISRWGSLSYLEPGVAGSFEGSAQVTTRDARMMVQEVDGTLVRLRPGNNGTSMGVYYDYMLNAFSDPLGAQMIKTNSQYWPAAMGTEYKPYTLWRSTPDLLWGIAYEVASFPTLKTKNFIALTGSSFDSSKHYVSFVTNTYVHSEYGTRTITDRAQITIIDDYVYCIDHCPWGTTRKVGFVLLRMPVNDIKTKTDVTWELLTGWTATGSFANTPVSDSINIAPMEYSTDPADNPMILGDAPMNATLYRSSWMFYIVSDAPGVIKVAMGGIMHYYTTQSLKVQALGWRCQIDVNARTASWVDAPTQIRCRINNGNLATISMDDNDAFKFTQTQLGLAANQTNTGGDEWGALYIDNNSGYYMKSYITNVLNTNIAWEIGQITNWTGKAAAWDILGRDVKRLRRQVDNPTFGSKVNNNLAMPVMLPGNRVMLRSMDENNGIKVVRAAYGTNSDYTYNAVTVGTVKGYEPQVDRVDMVGYDRNLRLITYLDDKDVLTNWGSVMTPWRTAVPVDVNSDGTYNSLTEMTWKTAEITAAAMSFARTLDVGPLVISANCDIYVPQDPTLPVLAVVMTRHTTEKGVQARMYVTGVDYTGPRRGAITDYTLKTTGHYNVVMAADNSSAVANNGPNQPGMVIQKVGTDLLIAAGSSTATNVPGSGTGRAMLFTYDLLTDTITPTNLKAVTCSVTTGAISWWPTVMPGRGMCMLDQDLSSQTYGTLMALLPMGSTVADYTSFTTSNKTQRFVLMAQEVRQGWVVYFTEEVPVILNGREGVVPITTVDLTAIKANPANTTFYCYVKENNFDMSYYLTTVEEAPTISKMFIGTIETGGSAINSIKLKKRSRVGIYQISDSRTGTSIPVSTGLPYQLGDWSWDM